MSDIVHPEGSSTLVQMSEGSLPVLVSQQGAKASYSFVEFFTNNLANDNTREAYARACYRFLEWCDTSGFTLETVHPVAVAAYFKQHPLSAPSVKQHLAAVKGLFDWFVVQGVVSYNPAASVKGPKYSVRKGKTPVLTPEETKQLLESVQGDNAKDLRDKAMLGVLFYAWVRVSALVNLDLKDYRHIGRRSYLRLKEKGGKTPELPVHHMAQEYLDRYLEEVGIDPDDPRQRTLPMFRSLDRKRQLTEKRLSRVDVFRMIRKRAARAGISSEICVHSARATGITTYLSSGGSIEGAQDIADHADPRTTRLYDRSRDKVTLSEIERVQY